MSGNGVSNVWTGSNVYPIASATFDAAGRNSGGTLVGSIASSFSFDVRNRLLSQTTDANESTLFLGTYTYLANSLVASGTTTQYGLFAADRALRFAYTYDTARRLRAADASTGATAASLTNTTAFDLNNVAYDRDGNITALQRQRSGNESYTYGYVTGSGRLAAVTGTGAAAGTFGHDRNGAITSITGGEYAQSSLYGRNGLPYQITANGQTTRYLYDHTGQRVYQSAGGGRYIVRGAFGEELAEYTGAGKLNAHMLGGYGRAENTGVKVGYVTDYLGSVRVAVELGGTVRQVVDYYPFGLQMPGRTYVSGSPTREGFTGHELDAETGMNYAGARFYLAALGRFTSTDPHAASYPGWSPYHYSADNPVSFIDPTGMDFCPASESDCSDGGAVDLARQCDESCSASDSCSELRASGYKRVNFHTSTPQERTEALLTWLVHVYRSGIPEGNIDFRDVFDFQFGDVGEVGTMTGPGNGTVDVVNLNFTYLDGRRVNVNYEAQYTIPSRRDGLIGRESIPSWGTVARGRPGIVNDPNSSPIQRRINGRVSGAYYAVWRSTAGSGRDSDLREFPMVRILTFDATSARALFHGILSLK